MVADAVKQTLAQVGIDQSAALLGSAELVPSTVSARPSARGAQATSSSSAAFAVRTAVPGPVQAPMSLVSTAATMSTALPTTAGDSFLMMVPSKANAGAQGRTGSSKARARVVSPRLNRLGFESARRKTSLVRQYLPLLLTRASLSNHRQRRAGFPENARALLNEGSQGEYPFPPHLERAVRSAIGGKPDELCGLYLSLAMHARSLKVESAEAHKEAVCN